MKIAAFSNWQRKFLGQILDYWQAHGHEVEYRLGYDPELHEWSDVCFVDVCDNNAKVASGYHFEGSRLVIRLIDIETWVHQPSGVNWDFVDVAIFGAKHTMEYVRTYVNFPDRTKVYHIPFGVDLSKWTFRERDGSGKNVALVAHRWSAKGVPLLLQVVDKLGPGWKLHLLGTKSGERWLHHYIDHMIGELGVDVVMEDWVDDLDGWLDDKDYHILPSFKESFSYVSGQSAAKGIKPLIHNFWRAGDIWPEEWIWNTIDECVDMILNQPYDSKSYLQFVEQNYSLDQMMMQINYVCGIN